MAAKIKRQASPTNVRQSVSNTDQVPGREDLGKHAALGLDALLSLFSVRQPVRCDHSDYLYTGVICTPRIP